MTGKPKGCRMVFDARINISRVDQQPEDILSTPPPENFCLLLRHIGDGKSSQDTIYCFSCVPLCHDAVAMKLQLGYFTPAVILVVPMA
ncbi:hypothetical protein ACJ73_00741 [Blastomyces percursus]|uniref:Uncharacterized protein n=1 Tax=Blastomyces percursus TaxID=1658174 RepID=A0A1J9R679_9EURO|nr:hypothetical protein ACJ73_00741 [Blastomyces percursus]